MHAGSQKDEVEAEASHSTAGVEGMAGDDVERLRNEIGELRAAIHAALERNAPLGVLEALTLRFLERGQRLVDLERRVAAR